MKVFLSFLILALSGSLPLVANETPDPFDNDLIQQVVKRHEQGVQGDAEAVKTLVADLEKWTQEQPNNYLLLAYLGSAYTLRSRDCFPGPSKFHYLKQGLQTMDKAVDSDPTNVGVRFVRAINNISLPAFIGRRDNARQDFKVLLTQISDPAKAPKLKTDTAQAIYYYAGLSYKQLNNPGEAKKAWQQGLALAPTSPLGIKMQAELAKVKI